MAAENLSADQLRKALNSYGFPCGPITATTKQVYVRKLNALRNQDGKAETKPDPPRRTSVGRPSSSNTPAPTAATATSSHSRSLNRLSSDESDGEQEEDHRRKPEVDADSVRRRSRNSLMRVTADPLEGIDNNGGSSYISSLTRPSIRSYGSPSTDGARLLADNTRTMPSPPRNWNGDASGRQKPKTAPVSTADSTPQSWQFISRLLLFLGIGFIIVLVAAYVFILRSPAPSNIPKSNYPVCPSTSLSTEVSPSICSSDQEHLLMQTLVDKLIADLGVRAGLVDCGYRSDSRDMKRSELLEYIGRFLTDFTAVRKVEDYLASIVEIFAQHEHWGIILQNDGEAVSLESKHGVKSIYCRFMQSALSVFGVLAVGLLVIALGFGVLLLIRYRRGLAEAERREVFDLVERIIDMLRQNAAASEAASEDPASRSMPPYLAIPHVRDVLIPLQQRRAKERVWDQAVNFISANESRIRVENQKISGEDFLVWCWIQPVMDGAKVWQGQAFGDATMSGVRSRHRTNVPLVPLTTCLKVRNMFDAAAETGSEWRMTVTDAILDKCSGAKIVHLAIDPSTLDGCVYIRCADLESAGTSFKALHGWWFDGRLVTVKYLREARYEERYPDSCRATTPLQPSSPERLSLSQPFHCSAIENS